LPPPIRLASGYRDFDERALQTLVFIERAQALGFSLKEIAAHLSLPGGMTARKAHLLERIQEKLAQLDDMSAQLKRKRQVLESLVPDLRNSLREGEHDRQQWGTYPRDIEEV
jgi:MerR family copper efflux transcriptional regulator